MKKGRVDTQGIKDWLSARITDKKEWQEVKEINPKTRLSWLVSIKKYDEAKKIITEGNIKITKDIFRHIVKNNNDEFIVWVLERANKQWKEAWTAFNENKKPVKQSECDDFPFSKLTEGEYDEPCFEIVARQGSIILIHEFLNVNMARGKSVYEQVMWRRDMSFLLKKVIFDLLRDKLTPFRKDYFDDDTSWWYISAMTAHDDQIISLMELGLKYGCSKSSSREYINGTSPAGVAVSKCVGKVNQDKYLAWFAENDFAFDCIDFLYSNKINGQNKISAMDFYHKQNNGKVKVNIRVKEIMLLNDEKLQQYLSENGYVE